ncbi:MAG: arsenite methyltransferase [Candidatus Marinimicrobia bacterium]|jgi:SAM-dependent methyltransferase|nr:arsenite methyltransferase [Candidatus Neomarinimicrobiota bacterium]MBT3618261.1 arsenite methyltransferase [Candidatus Neomarinimicrobiota bacterium]MBT3829587.1 arsenite methyltransferase [Candidatus Neomarinimicrobiota bacterium]MBT3997470.1 arsenite methyltransferase [Candidatus Neomarinimicrobiota bacterium]MBT4281660.1 arsenite methyltransferase [Candidatus Neomarinimicrobiota bacterium]
MKINNEIKNIVQEKYAEIVTQKPSCCSPAAEMDYSAFSLDYTQMEGYMEEADLKLGCGIPTEFANIKEGDTVVDLGSGAGNDVFVARQITGNSGHVIGIDMTQEMVEKANLNKTKLGFKNIEFIQGDIEDLPLDDKMCNVVVSNCVLNLVPDKEKAFSEIYRILKPGAHFCVSDIVIEGEIPGGLKKSAELYAGCVSGALQKNDYLNKIKKAGFINIEIKKSREIVLPDALLKSFLDDIQLEKYNKSGLGIYSITVVASKN